MPSWVNAATILACSNVLIGISVVVVSLLLRQQVRRYEQFRAEAAMMFGECFERLNDHEVRLMQAGYPPGRVVPTDLPNWLPQGIAPPDPNRR